MATTTYSGRNRSSCSSVAVERRSTLTDVLLNPDDKYKTWRAENNQVMSWLVNSMALERGKNFMLYNTAREIWEAARELYSAASNTSLQFEIKGLLRKVRRMLLFITTPSHNFGSRLICMKQ